MASTVFIGWSTFLNSQMRCRSLDPRSSSSFLVPDLLMSYGGEYPLSRQLCRGISRSCLSLELPKDDLVHAGTRVDEGGGDDGEASSLLRCLRGAEEASRLSAWPTRRCRRRVAFAARGTPCYRQGETCDTRREDDHVLLCSTSLLPFR